MNISFPLSGLEVALLCLLVPALAIIGGFSAWMMRAHPHCMTWPEIIARLAFGLGLVVALIVFLPFTRG
jgi:hypothetical protein